VTELCENSICTDSAKGPHRWADIVGWHCYQTVRLCVKFCLKIRQFHYRHSTILWVVFSDQLQQLDEREKLVFHIWWWNHCQHILFSLLCSFVHQETSCINSWLCI